MTLTDEMKEQQAEIAGLISTVSHLEKELADLKSGVHRMVKSLHKDGYMKYIPFKLD